MKISLAILLAVTSSFASAQAATPVSRYLPNIIDRVSQCSVLPFSINADGEKTYHALFSHCPEVKIISPGMAKIKVAAHIYQAVLSESPDSDGDFFHVTIQDVRTGESEEYQNIPAYGDVLLGVLGGNTDHLVQQEITEEAAVSSDATLLRTLFY